jgi:hypothetical protein
MDRNIDYNNLSREQKEIIDKLYDNGYISRVAYSELTEKDVSTQNNTGWKSNIESQR